MGKTFRLFIDGKIPKGTHQMKGERVVVPKGRGRKPYVHHYDTQTIKDARNAFRAMFSRHAPSEPYSGAIQVKMYFLYPFNKTELKSVVKSGWKWKTTRPDTDNIFKLPCDVLTDLGYWTDDAVVSEPILRKAFAKRSGIYLEIKELSDEIPDDMKDVLLTSENNMTC